MVRTEERECVKKGRVKGNERGGKEIAKTGKEEADKREKRGKNEKSDAHQYTVNINSARESVNRGRERNESTISERKPSHASPITENSTQKKKKKCPTHTHSPRFTPLSLTHSRGLCASYSSVYEGEYWLLRCGTIL